MKNNTHTNSLVLAGWAIGLMLVLFSTTLAADRMTPIDPATVKMDGETGRRFQATIDNNLMKLDIEKTFLQPFREKKQGKNKSHTVRYVGLGKLIDASVSFAAQTKDPKVIALKDRLIRETIKTQMPDGYIGIFKPDHRIKEYWDVHEMVYIIHGLANDYRQFKNKTSLEAARKLADYLMKNRKPTDPPRLVGKLNAERAFLVLYQATGDKKYLDYGIASENLRKWSQPVSGHAYTFMDVCIAQLDLNQIEPNDKLPKQSRQVIDFLRTKDGLFVNGTCSRREGFGSDQILAGNVGETCATGYLIRMLHRMLCIDEDPIYGDIMERAIHNALFAAQLPDGRRLRYFTPLEGPRPVYPHDHYCCPNNFRRIVAELPRMIYYRTKDGGLCINLYGPSSATIPMGDEGKQPVKIRQETNYPNSGKVTIHVDPTRPAKFPLQLRIPAWAQKTKVTVNGSPIDQPVASGSFLRLDRQWKAGDRVELDMPMTWRLVRGRKAQKGRVAVLRGPLLFCLDPESLLKLNPAVAKELNELIRDIDNPKAKKEVRQGWLTNFVKNLQLDPTSFGDPVADTTIHPDGIACPVRAWSPTAPTTEKPDLQLRLTEFPDPAGTATYFLVPKKTATVDDELIKKKR
ncbi:MAG: glycoside hydrolase family 127 protein [Planctomycetia bacterium]